MANEQHVQWLNEGVAAWNKRRKDTELVPDLSHLRLPDGVSTGFDLPGADLSFALLNDADLRGANLKGAILASADLRRARLQNAKLEEARLYRANLSDTGLAGARLNDARLQRADLTEADLAGARLTGAYLDNAKIMGANLINTDLVDVAWPPPELWQARIFPEGTSPKQYPIEPERVTTVGDLLDGVNRVRDLYRDAHEEVLLYFRGESQVGWELQPSVMRDDRLITSESRMLIELGSRRPDDFAGTPSALAQWVLAQHHGLKTRLLDITSNPMVALFHACDTVDSEEPEEGRVHVFAAPRSLVKPFTSDTVSIMANVARLSRDDQSELVPEPGPNYPRAMRRLYQLIRTEKPYFDERIDPRDFYRVLVVEPQRASERLRAQAGAFLLSVFHRRFERDEVLGWNADTPLYAQYELTVPGNHKETIRAELRSLNVTRENLFPGLDASAEAITEQVLAAATRTAGGTL